MKLLLALFTCSLLFAFSCGEPQIDTETANSPKTATLAANATEVKESKQSEAMEPVSKKPMDIGTPANNISKKEPVTKEIEKVDEDLTTKEARKKKRRTSKTSSDKKKKAESKEKTKKASSKDLILAKDSKSERDYPMELKKTSTEGTPVATFSTTTHDFGHISQGEKITHDFVFTNTGEADLEILNVDVTCGCTVPTFPFIPIAPGEKGTISVSYNSTGKLGNQKPMITIITNAKPRTYKLYFKGVVDADRAKPESTDPKNNK